jgi:hypothetical protein
MPVVVYRCTHCHREVLVRKPGPMSDAEIRRRIAEEMRPWPTGRGGRVDQGSRLRDDIWVAVSGMRDSSVPRSTVPEECPACNRKDALVESRTLEG